MCHPSTQPLSTLTRDRDAEPAPPPGRLPPLFDGVVEHASPLFLGIRTSDGAYRLVHAGTLEAPLCEAWSRT
jgi:hypothetical protein